NSSSAGLTARYVGRREGNRIVGQVTWTWQGKSWSGTWSAELAAAPRPPTPSLIPVQVLSVAQAETAFARMAAQSDIAFHYPNDGCYARAHLMVRRMQSMGIHARKAWTFANGELLHANTPYDEFHRGYVEWMYHVAPVVRVHYARG